MEFYNYSPVSKGVQEEILKKKEEEKREGSK